MKVKLQSKSKLQLVKAVREVLDLDLKEAKDLVDEQEMKEDMGLHVIVDSEKTEEQIKTLIKQLDVRCTPLSDSDFCKPTCKQTETIKITSAGVGPLLDAAMKFLQLSPKEARDFVREHAVHEPTCIWMCIDVNRPRKEIEACARNIPGIEVEFLNDLDMAAPETTDNQGTVQVPQKATNEVTDEDLGVSIHSIDEESIGWQCKMLFTHEQATRVLAGLHDAKFNVTEALAMYEGNKTTMLVVTKTFPTGTRKKDFEKFEKLIHEFVRNICEIVNLEERIESAKERAIEAFDELQDYE